MELASCYRALGLNLDAEDCYKTVIENDGDSGQAESELAAIRRQHGSSQLEATNASDVSSNAEPNHRGAYGRRICRVRDTPSTDPPSRLAILAPRASRQTAKQSAVGREQFREVEVHDLFLRRQVIARELAGNNEVAEAVWTDASRKLLHAFQDNRIFFPSDKHHRFYGYTKEARSLASKPKYQLDMLFEKSATAIGRPNAQASSMRRH